MFKSSGTLRNWDSKYVSTVCSLTFWKNKLWKCLEVRVQNLYASLSKCWSRALWVFISVVCLFHGNECMVGMDGMKTCIFKSKQSLGERKSNKLCKGNNWGLKWKKGWRRMNSVWWGERKKLEPRGKGQARGGESLHFGNSDCCLFQSGPSFGLICFEFVSVLLKQESLNYFSRLIYTSSFDSFPNADSQGDKIICPKSHNW